MELLKYLKNGSVLVVPNTIKKTLLEEIDTLDTLLNIKMMTKQEFIKQYYFDYDKETLIYLTNKYDIKLEVAKVFLNNMYKLNDTFTSSNTINELTLMKNNLLDHGLLKTNNIFKEYLKNHPVVFYGYDYYLKEDERLIEELKTITDVQVFRQSENPERQLTVYEFSDIYEEVNYVFDKICTLLKTGVNIDQIKLAGISSEYEEVLLDFSKFYKLPLSLSKKIPLYETNIGKKACAYLKEGYDFYDTIQFLRKEYQEDELIDLVVNIFNQYAFFKEEKKNILMFIEDDMKHTYKKEKKKKNRIEIIELENCEISSSNYIFLLGFNNGNFPKVKKDEDFISNNLKEEIGLSTTLEENKLVKKALMNHLFLITNLTITYKLKTYFEEYYPSTLINDYKMKVERIENQDRYHYSKIYDTINLTSMLDNYIKYGLKDKNLETYYSTLKLPYLTYDNRYTKIKKDELLDYLNSKLLLSYSALDNFYHCKFRFYLQNILKITKYEESLSQKIGNIFHAVLKEAFTEDFNFEETYNKELEKYELTNKEKFYLEKLKPELLLTIEVINKQNKILGFDQSMYEEKIYIPLDNELKTTFMGIVDKIRYQEKDGETLVSIIDYKTGNTNLDLRYIPYGIHMQLPAYMYLIKKSEKFKNAKICGIYLQKLLSTISYSKSPIEEEKENALKLQGYSTTDEFYLEKWDPSYEKSEIIKSLKKSKNGWYTYAKLLSFNEMDKLVEITEQKIKEASLDITNCDFSINPKRIEQENIGCNFCSFKDICYKTEKDIVDLEKIKDLSYLNDENEVSDNA